MGCNETSIPDGWVLASLEDVCEILDSLRIPVNNSERTKRIEGKSNEELYPYYGATGQVGLIDNYLFQGEYLLLGEDGAPFLEPFKDKAYLVNKKFWVNNHAHILKVNISSEYLCYFLNQIDYSEHVTGTTRLKLNQAALRQIPIIFAPENEQRRIVAKIEELFSELDKGIESLKAAREQLKIYRQAVLKYAFEGKLTAQWREEHKDKLESPEQLLTCIEESGSSLKIPESWCFSFVKNLVVQGPSNGRSVKDRTDGFPVLRLTALKAGKIDLKERKFGDWDRDAAEPFIVKAGDFLLSRGNGSKHLVGRGGIVPIHDGEVAFPDTMVRLRVDQNVMLIEFFGLVWESRIIRDQIEKSARTTAGIHKINQKHIENFLLPVPSIPEQKNIADRLSEQLSVIDSVEEEVTKRLANSETLRQAILKKAFSGQLVPQDPTDEPAAVLLDRIRAAKAAQPKAAKKPRQSKPPSAEYN